MKVLSTSALGKSGGPAGGCGEELALGTAVQACRRLGNGAGLPWALKSSYPILTRVFMPLPRWAAPPQEHCQMDQRATSVAP